MPAVRKSESATATTSNTQPSGVYTYSIFPYGVSHAIEGSRRTGVDNHRHQPIPLRRSARLAAKGKNAICNDKPIIPNLPFLEQERTQGIPPVYRSVHPKIVAKTPSWPPHGNGQLRREYSFVLADCGTHFEMISPKVARQLPRLHPSVPAVAPYLVANPTVSQPKNRRGPKCRRDEEPPQAGQKTVVQTRRKRGRPMDDGDDLNSGPVADASQPAWKRRRN